MQELSSCQQARGFRYFLFFIYLVTISNQGSPFNRCRVHLGIWDTIIKYNYVKYTVLQIKCKFMMQFAWVNINRVYCKIVMVVYSYIGRAEDIDRAEGGLEKEEL